VFEEGRISVARAAALWLESSALSSGHARYRIVGRGRGPAAIFSNLDRLSILFFCLSVLVVRDTFLQ